jgi:hypothetical protein
VRDELRTRRKELWAGARALQEELATGFKLGMGSFSDTLTALGIVQKMHLEGVTNSYRDVRLGAWSGGAPRFARPATQLLLPCCHT